MKEVVTDEQITEEALRLLKRDARFHRHLEGGIYAIRLAWRPSLSLFAKDTGELREKIEAAIRERNAKS
jgi:hypothetical protein